MEQSKPAAPLPMDAKPPKSKSQPYYAIHPLWEDVVPIPQPDQTGTLAAIRYWPRYSEAMSYLRAVMAENEISGRALALTEDLISMNPAHYTVWIYRMNVLKGLWTGTKVSRTDTEKPEESTQTADEVGQGQVESKSEILWSNVKNELKWLDEVSFRNLKNYQIWHHRHALIDLLPEDPAGRPFDTTPPHVHVVSKPPEAASATQSTGESTWGFDDISQKETTTQSPTPLDETEIQKISELIKSEQTFLSQILSLDTKNYHVWSYRQWLCTRYPSFLLPSYALSTSHTNTTASPVNTQSTPIQIQSSVEPQPSIASSYRSHAEVEAIDTLIIDDLRNNSAWSHRYFLLFGHHELRYSLVHNAILKTVNEQRLLDAEGEVDTGLVDAEIAYTQAEIRRAPMNSSSWNYLRGVLGHGGRDLRTMQTFCEEFLGPDGDLWTDQYVNVSSTPVDGDGQEAIERQEVGVRSARAIEWLSEIYAQEGTEQGRMRAKECLRSLAEKWDVIRQGYWHYLGEKMEKECKLQESATK